VIGINTAIFTRDGGSLGIGFAIPSDMVRVVVAASVSGGRLVRPWFGATSQTVSADIAQSLACRGPLGAVLAAGRARQPADARASGATTS